MLLKKVICFTTAIIVLSTSVLASPRLSTDTDEVTISKNSEGAVKLLTSDVPNHRLPTDPDGWITISKSSGGETKVLTSTAPNNQGYGNYGKVVTSYMYVNDDNTFCVIDFSNNTINIDTYNSQTYEWIKNKKIAMELPLFGGVYCGSKYNFIVFGQNNISENDNVITFKTVKYTKDWEKIGAADYSNNNTIKPFEVGSLRMTEHNNYLYVRSCHQMYQSRDGYNHQANITYSVDIDKMEIADQFSKVMNTDYGYVSHSFDQYIAVDDGKLVALDLGDAYPRSVVLTKYNTILNKGKFSSDGMCSSVDMLKIAGNTGNNYTGVTVGGFEVSENNYIAAVSTINQNNGNSTKRDVMLLITDKKDSKNVKQVNITNYANSKEDLSASKPYITKLPNGNYMLLWEVFAEGSPRNMEVKIVDENGNTSKELTAGTTFMGMLSSDCQPICINGKVVWYTNGVSPSGEPERTFYKLDFHAKN
ncbi:hypothetical protein [Clostridium sp. MD294]|uniref:hypothetical protein n=1 Tax=Clostridium sp. MD294 TaxID=97138 RepID=UPI0002C90080|nr:hypothetical protein [Clostridium sp. MD294]NDO46481.1 hypothetical protein [Clostridium sp. MD294]USF29089.1 hypothetical protein C820_000472 [Clostridium sp. MD294]